MSRIVCPLNNILGDYLNMWCPSSEIDYIMTQCCVGWWLFHYSISASNTMKIYMYTPLPSYAALYLATDEPIEKVPLHVYQGPNSVFGTSDVVSTWIAVAVTSRGGGMDGMSNDIGQSIIVHMDVLEHAHTQSQLNHSALIFELQSYNSSQFRVWNNNICSFGSTLQGFLVRQRASNCDVLHSGQADTP